MCTPTFRRHIFFIFNDTQKNLITAILMGIYAAVSFSLSCGPCVCFWWRWYVPCDIRYGITWVLAASANRRQLELRHSITNERTTQRNRKQRTTNNNNNNWNSCLLVIYVWGQRKASIRLLHSNFICDRRTPKKQQTGNCFQCLSRHQLLLFICRAVCVNLYRPAMPYATSSYCTLHDCKSMATTINDVGTVVSYVRGAHCNHSDFGYHKQKINKRNK